MDLESSASVIYKAPVVHFLIKYFLECAEKNEIATYEGMKKFTGVDCKAKRHNVYKAINTLRERAGLIFRNVPNEGYKCLGNAEIADASTNVGMAKVSAAINIWRSEMRAIKVELLQPDEQINYTLGALKLSLMEESIETTRSPQLEEKAARISDLNEDIGNIKGLLGRLVS